LREDEKGTVSGASADGSQAHAGQAAASDLLKPYDARQMRCYPVSVRINHVANDDEECSAPVELAQIQNRLFS